MGCTGMRDQLEQNVPVERLIGNTEMFSKKEAKNTKNYCKQLKPV